MSFLSGLERQAVPDHVGKSMIIVEDEAMVSTTIEMFATELGWRVVGAAYSETSALELVQRVNPTVAVMDIHLGSATSFSVAHSCRVRGIVVLFMTGYTAENLPKECGDDPVLAKPFSVEEFEQALGRCIAAQVMSGEQ
jgi:DNA-binding response OmpR family regulator